MNRKQEMQPALEKQYPFHLISHKLCPFVQRSIIVLIEKNARFARTDVNLAEPPSWFSQISPLGLTPVLLTDTNEALFESAVICEYINEVTPGDLHPTDPLEKARHRSWIEFGSKILDSFLKLCFCKEEKEFNQCEQDIKLKFSMLESILSEGPFFSGGSFRLIDAVYAPIFRFFDILDQHIQPDILENLPKIGFWRQALSERHSVQNAVTHEYSQCFVNFMLERKSHLSSLLN